MNYDKEVDEILEYIENYLNQLKGKGFGELRRFAEGVGLTSKNMSDFSNKYGRGANPQFRTVYKLLRGILKRKPIELNIKQDKISNELVRISESLESLKILIK